MSPEQLRELGYDLAPDSHARLTRFVAALLEENARHNLTAIRDEAGVWARHICDALALLPHLDAERPATLLDLGSGGGLPGLPLACARPRITVSLLDSTRKKIDATRRIADALALSNVRSLWGRAEVLAHERSHRERFDIVTARAVAALDHLVEYCSGFVRVGGICVFPKSQRGVEEELPTAVPIARQCGLVHESTLHYRLPEDSIDRALVFFRKHSPTPPQLPRDGSKLGTPCNPPGRLTHD